MDVLNTHLPRLLDLASNFNIDLSGVLAGYAQKLKNEVPGMENFSFPEAALLLQHCAEIYGRKVDYVYNLAIELCENMNSRMYGSLGPSQEVGTDDSVAIIKKTRRRKTVAQISTEDFKLHFFSLDKPKVLKKCKKNRSHCREVMCVRLAAVNLGTSHEFHIYEDDQYASIGTKDQFRLNWPVEQNCRLEEYINDEGSGSVWDVMDVGVSNMPTPAYSDDGAPEAPEAVPETDIEINPSLSCIAGDNSEQETDLILGTQTEIPSSKPMEIVEKQNASKTVPFKLPYELTKKGQLKGKEEKNITMFLFSNLLKRELKMKGALPPFSKSRNGDKKLITQHVHFLMKRFNLDVEDKFNAQLLVDHQEDFLGFDEVILPEVPDVLSSTYETDSPDDPINDDMAVEEIFGNEVFDDTTHFEDDVPIDYNAKKKSYVDAQGVTNWRHLMQDRLSGEEKQRKFDVHEYGTNIIDAFQNIGQTLSFGDIVKGLDEREISRYFVSSLMLANTTNLSLEDHGPNTLTVTLNHKERYHEMEDILVPPSVGGLTPSVSEVTPSPRQTKRKANSDSGSDDDEETRQTGSFKQIPGKGPWRNKSKKGRDK